MSDCLKQTSAHSFRTILVHYTLMVVSLLVSLSLTGCEAIGAMSILTGCIMRPSVTVTPSTLPIGKIEEHYSVNISAPAAEMFVEIQENSIQPFPPPIEFSVQTLKQSPFKLPNGLTLDSPKGNNHASINITGTPDSSGKFKIIVSGYTYGTNCVGQNFNKTYQLITQ